VARAHVLAFLVAGAAAIGALQLRAKPAPVERPPSRVLRVATPAQPPRVRPAPNPDMEPLLAEVRAGYTIGGASVGLLGTESAFHRAGARLRPEADTTLLTWLVEDEHPVVRALGLRGAALRGDLGTLAMHFCDREVVPVCPGGCICSENTIGEMARTLAQSPAWLDGGRDARPPLLAVEARREIEVLTTAVDGCGAASKLGLSAPAIELSQWSFAALRKALPTLPAWIIVKAVARHNAVPEELARVLQDEALPADARLAAASGLTLRGGPEAESAIEGSAAFLRSRGSGLLDRLRHALASRKKVQLAVDRVAAARTWQDAQALADLVIDAYQIRHPLVLDQRVVFFGDRMADIERARGQALVWVARNLGDHRACWDQYRSTAYDLERLFDQHVMVALGAKLTPEERAEVVATVTAEVARLDADLRCRSY